MKERPTPPRGPAGASLDDAAIGRHLGRLSTAYPEFRFSRESIGRKGARWVAESRDCADGNPRDARGRDDQLPEQADS